MRVITSFSRNVHGTLVGALWVMLSAGVALADTNWTLQGIHIYNTNSGNVGIGTTTPSELLHLYKNTNANVALRFENPNSGSGTAMYLLTTDGSGNVYFGQDGAGTGTARASQGYIYSDTAPGVGLWAAHASGLIRFYTGGSTAANERMRIDSTGKVGIGNPAPSQALDVTGNIKLSGSIISDGDICIGTCQ